MRSKEDLAASQRGAADVLGYVVVVAYQDPTLAAQEFEDRELTPARYVRVEEGVQLAMARDDPIRRVCADVPAPTNPSLNQLILRCLVR